VSAGSATPRSACTSCEPPAAQNGPSDPLALVGLQPLMAVSKGSSAVAVAMIDGPVAISHPDLELDGLTLIGDASGAACDPAHAGLACRHATYVAGILKARRGARAPALCPGCPLLVRAIFDDGGSPSAAPSELAAAIVECLAAGARLINLSSVLLRASDAGNRALLRALDQALRQGAIVVAAAGNQGVVAGSSITGHPAVIPVVAYGRAGRPSPATNLGATIGRQGVGAPGEGIESLGLDKPEVAGGTSAAAPFVTGTLALLWSIFSSASPLALRSAVRPFGTRRSIVPPLLDAGAAHAYLSQLLSGSAPASRRHMKLHLRHAGAVIPATSALDRGLEPAQETPVPPDAGVGQAPPDPGAAGMPAARFVYAIGNIELQFRDTSVEREFAHALSLGATEGQTDQQALHSVLTARENRYLARQLCYIFTVAGVETYLLIPEVPEDYDSLLEAVRPERGPADVDVVVGVIGPVAPPELCGGRQLPIVQFSRLYSFTRDELIESIPKPQGTTKADFEKTAAEVLGRVMQVADNAGSLDEHRALNFLSVRRAEIYQLAADRFGNNQSLTAIEARPSRLSGVERIVDVIFTFTHRQTGVAERDFVRVNVTSLFPYVVSPLQPYFDR
jgi:hypothetical protein